MLDQSYAAKICCADLYSSDLARLILGDSLHPGGLRVTNRLGRIMGLQPGWRVLDLACGMGTSANAISRVFRCHVTGLELGAEGTAASRRRSLEQPMPANVDFVRGRRFRLPRVRHQPSTSPQPWPKLFACCGPAECASGLYPVSP